MRTESPLLSDERSTSVAELVAFTKKELEADAERQAKVGTLHSSNLTRESQAGSTLDLSHKRIATLPVEVIALIKDNVERLALSRNPLIVLPSEIIQCDRLRYLNLRWNQLEVFPEPVLHLHRLEILDVSKNQITWIPEDIRKMTSLKFLAIARNQISRLPFALGDMTSLSKLKFDENPIKFPPLDAIKPSPTSNLHFEREKDICVLVKRYLKLHAAREKTSSSTSEELTESNVETPRPPKRSATGGRFPVRPSISNIESSIDETKTTPSKDLVPPIPLKSHARGSSYTTMPASRHAAANAASAALPFDYARSRSETVLPALNVRTRRQGFVPRKTSARDPTAAHGPKTMGNYTGDLPPSQLHSRDNSSASSTGWLLPVPGSPDASSAATSPVDIARRINRSKNHADVHNQPTQNPWRNKTNGVTTQAWRLFTVLSQLHLPMESVIMALRDDGTSRPHDDRLLLNVSTQLQALGRNVDALTGQSAEDSIHGRLITATVHAATDALNAFRVALRSLKDYTCKMTASVDSFKLRNLMFQVFYAISEARNICACLNSHVRTASSNHVVRPSNTTISQNMHSVQNKSVNNRRLRGATILRSMSSTATLRAVPPPMALSNLPSRTTSLANGAKPSQPLAPMNPATTSLRSTAPRSVPEDVRSHPFRNLVDEADGDEQFDRIFLRLRDASDMIHQSLPALRRECQTRREHASGAGQAPVANLWSLSLHRLDAMGNINNTLTTRLQVVQVKDPSVRTHKDFWQLCDSFVNAWADIGLAMQELSRHRVDIASLKTMMRPVQKSMKDVSKVIFESPLYHQIVRSAGASHGTAPVLAPAFPYMSANAYPGNNVAVPGSAGGYHTPLPATPLSAALGPAVQATVSSSALHSHAESSTITGVAGPSRSTYERVDNPSQSKNLGRR